MNSQPSPLNPQPSVRLHIERVVLDGVALSAAEQPRFRAALAEELSRMFRAEPVDAWRGGARARLDGGAVLWAADGATETSARLVAKSLFAALQSDSQFSAGIVPAESARGIVGESRHHPAPHEATKNQTNK